MRQFLLKGVLSTVAVALVAGFHLASVQAREAAPVKDKAKTEGKTATGAKVDINSAAQADLEKLPGVGAVTAKKIVAGRPYSSVAELSKAGVSARTIEKITPLVMVGAAPAAVPAATPKATTPRAPAPATPAAPRVTKQVQPPPAGGGMVWVNPDSKIYHREGSRWYGKTKQGSYMTEAEAVKAGYRESRQGAR